MTCTTHGVRTAPKVRLAPETRKEPETRVAPARYTRRRRLRGRGPLVIGACAVAVLVGVLVCVLLAGGGWASGFPGEGAVSAAGSPGEGAVSTPRSEWREGEVPHLYQTDPAWAEDPYAGGTIEERGCGPTCLSMVYVALTGRTDLGPAEMAAFSEREGYVADGMTAWSLMTDGAAELGLLGEELPADAGMLKAALEAGRPVIASMLPGDFTTTGHFIVLAGLDEEGRLIVRDPNSAERSERTWDVQLVLDQCANLWAFSRAS